MQKKMMKISKKQIATFMVLSVMMSFAITLQVSGICCYGRRNNKKWI